jgi:hypothetical protein
MTDKAGSNAAGNDLGKVMSIARLTELLAAYGASPQRWPADERAVAQTLLAHIDRLGTAEERAALRAALDEARALDDVLADAFAPLPDAAMARLTAAVAFPPPRGGPARTGARTGARETRGFSLFDLFGVVFKPAAAVGAVMAALGLFVGFSVDPAYSNGDGSDYSVSQNVDASFGLLGEGENGQ